MQGILMKADMLRATVEGRKTNTRRAEASLREINKEPNIWACTETLGREFCFYNPLTLRNIRIKPRYHVGETVYIKEAWQVDKKWDNTKPSDIPHGESVYYPFGGDPEDKIPAPYWLGKLRSPLFMPAWAARHFILIEAVRAERLQQIGQTDISLEGIKMRRLQPNEDYYHHLTVNRDSFAHLWDSINPKYPFVTNPWVWRYQFRLER